MILSSIGTLLLLIVTTSIACSEQQEFKIQKILPKFVKVPEYYYVEGSGLNPWNHVDSRSSALFLSVEVEFSYQPRLKTDETRYVDQLLFTYYLLLNRRSQQKPLLLVGSVLHDAVCAGKTGRSVMYLAPSTLDRFFPGRIPLGIPHVIHDIGITISKDNQLMTYQSWKGRGLWWMQYSATPDFLLNKNQTPFAPLLWEEFQQIHVIPESS